jgi:hypothetical protein
MCLFVTSEKTLETIRQGQRGQHVGYSWANHRQLARLFAAKRLACGWRRAMADRGRPSADREISDSESE